MIDQRGRRRDQFSRSQFDRFPVVISLFCYRDVPDNNVEMTSRRVGRAEVSGIATAIRGKSRRRRKLRCNTDDGETRYLAFRRARVWNRINRLQNSVNSSGRLLRPGRAPRFRNSLQLGSVSAHRILGSRRNLVLQQADKNTAVASICATDTALITHTPSPRIYHSANQLSA